MSRYDRDRRRRTRGTRRPDPRIERQIARGARRRAQRRQRRRRRRLLRAARPRRRRRRALGRDDRPASARSARRPSRARPSRCRSRTASFDAALAVLTMHHWSDWRAGVAELRRVARRRIVMFTFDPALHRALLARARLPAGDRGARRGALPAARRRSPRRSAALRSCPVPIADDCTDGFLCAYWRRPLAYLDPGVRSNISSLALLPATRHRARHGAARARRRRRHVGRAQRRAARAATSTTSATGCSSRSALTARPTHPPMIRQRTRPSQQGADDDGARRRCYLRYVTAADGVARAQSGARERRGSRSSTRSSSARRTPSGSTRDAFAARAAHGSGPVALRRRSRACCGQHCGG